jgi:phenylalanyl-tRNA synthetase alpha chain
MKEKITKLKAEAIKEIKNSKTLAEVKKLEVKFLGRRGQLTGILRTLKDMTTEQKQAVGKAANEVKEELERVIAEVGQRFTEQEVDLTAGPLDITLPGRKREVGSLHPISIVKKELKDIFSKMGFMVMEGPELESEYYNFEALNIPDTHPARDTMDTFYIKDKPGRLMRTHTSNQQVRMMEKYGAPLRAVFPGRCFRYEATDAAHDTTFYQMEGLMIDRNISVTNLISVMKVLLKEIFKKDVKVRMRPGYFPFVEPGFELDINCLICDGKGCSVCKQSGWVELVPCGLVHPKVLSYGGLDPKEWSGFAFGLGLTRLVMMKYGIDDIRLLLAGDLRVLKQF